MKGSEYLVLRAAVAFALMAAGAGAVTVVAVFVLPWVADRLDGREGSAWAMLMVGAAVLALVARLVPLALGRALAAIDRRVGERGGISDYDGE